MATTRIMPPEGSYGTIDFVTPEFWAETARWLDTSGQNRNAVVPYTKDLESSYSGGAKPGALTVPDWLLRGDAPDKKLLDAIDAARGLKPEAAKPPSPQITIPTIPEPSSPQPGPAVSNPFTPQVSLPTWTQAGMENNLSQDSWDMFSRATAANNNGGLYQPPQTGWS